MKFLIRVAGSASVSTHWRNFAHAELMFGDVARSWMIQINPDYPGFLLAVLPPGAFFGLALMIVTKNWLDMRPAAAPRAAPVAAEGA